MCREQLYYQVTCWDLWQCHLKLLSHVTAEEKLSETTPRAENVYVCEELSVEQGKAVQWLLIKLLQWAIIFEGSKFCSSTAFHGP